MKRTHMSEVQTPNVTPPNVPQTILWMLSPPHLHLNRNLEVPTSRNMHHHDGFHGRNNVTPGHNGGTDNNLLYS